MNVLLQMPAMGSLSPRRSLYRTLSDESVCSNRKCSSYASSRSSMLDQAMPSDILFSSTPPYHSTLPPRMVHNQAASNLRSKCTSEHNRGGQAQSPSLGTLQENRLSFLWRFNGPFRLNTPACFPVATVVVRSKTRSCGASGPLLRMPRRALGSLVSGTLSDYHPSSLAPVGTHVLV